MLTYLNHKGRKEFPARRCHPSRTAASVKREMCLKTRLPFRLCNTCQTASKLNSSPENKRNEEVMGKIRLNEMFPRVKYSMLKETPWEKTFRGEKVNTTIKFLTETERTGSLNCAFVSWSFPPPPPPPEPSLCFVLFLRVFLMGTHFKIHHSKCLIWNFWGRNASRRFGRV